MEPADSNSMWEQVAITNPLQWMSLQIAAVPPNVRRANEPQPTFGDCVGVYLAPTGDACAVRLLEASAEKAFTPLNTKQVKDPGDFIDVKWPKPKPAAEFDVCRVVMLAVLKMSRAEIDKLIVEHRGAQIPKVKQDSMFTKESSELVSDLLDRNDTTTLTQSVHRISEAKKANKEKEEKKSVEQEDQIELGKRDKKEKLAKKDKSDKKSSKK